MRSGGHVLLVVGALMGVCVVTCSSSSASIRSGSGVDAVVNPVVNPKIHVEVTNRFASGSFNIHCKSKNDDLGFHDIWPGQKYNLVFRNNVWGTTLFFCTIKSEYGQAVFDLYKAQRDLKRCKTVCIWDTFSDAIYGYKEDGTAHLRDITIKWTK